MLAPRALHQAQIWGLKTRKNGAVTALVSKKQLDLIFPQTLIKEPVVYQMAREYAVVFNIRRAKITDKIGELVLEMEGEDKVLDSAIAWLKKKGIRVEPVTHDSIEG